MKNIKLEITIDEANAILASLGEQPYLKVVELIQKIQSQGAAQLSGPALGDPGKEEVKESLETA